MENRKKLTDDELNAVNGGVTYDNSAGNHTIYKIGKNGGPFTHTFSYLDYDEIRRIIDETDDPSVPVAQNEENIMLALIASGKLTPIA